jgi:hypothetical protein
MIYKILLGVVIFLSACTTFNSNENGVRRACKSGVSKYDDGSTTFECDRKPVGKANM